MFTFVFVMAIAMSVLTGTILTVRNLMTEPVNAGRHRSTPNNERYHVRVLLEELRAL